MLIKQFIMKTPKGQKIEHNISKEKELWNLKKEVLIERLMERDKKYEKWLKQQQKEARIIEKYL